MRWPWSRPEPEPDMSTWPGPPAPLPGGAPRAGDAWTGPPGRRALTDPTQVLGLPLLTRGQAWRSRGGGW